MIRGGGGGEVIIEGRLTPIIINMYCIVCLLSRCRVLKWMMDNENVNRGVSSTYPDSDKTSSSHNRRSHKTALPPQVPPPTFKQKYVEHFIIGFIEI